MSIIAYGPFALIISFNRRLCIHFSSNLFPQGSISEPGLGMLSWWNSWYRFHFLWISVWKATSSYDVSWQCKWSRGSDGKVQDVWNLCNGSVAHLIFIYVVKLWNYVEYIFSVSDFICFSFLLKFKGKYIKSVFGYYGLLYN